MAALGAIVLLAVGLVLLLAPAAGARREVWARGRRGGAAERALDRAREVLRTGGRGKRLRRAQVRDWLPPLWADAAVLYNPGARVGLREALRLAVEHRGGWLAGGLRAALEQARVADVGEVLEEWAGGVGYAPLEDDVATLVAAFRAGVDLGRTLATLGREAAERQMAELELATGRSEVIATLVGVPAALFGLMGLMGYVLMVLFSKGLGAFLGG